MNAKVAVFVICVEVIICLLLHNCMAVSLMFSELYASIYFQDFVITCIIWLYVNYI